MPKSAKKSAKKPSSTTKPERTKAVMPSPSAVARSNAGKRNDATSKQDRVIAMLRSPGGTTIAAMMQETGWQPHSVRGFLAGVVRKKLKLKLDSNRIDGNRVYRITGGGSSKASGQPSKRSPT